MKTKVLAILLALVFVLSAFPIAVGAAEPTAYTDSTRVGLTMTVKQTSPAGEGPAVKINTEDMDVNTEYTFTASLRVGDIWKKVEKWYDTAKKILDVRYGAGDSAEKSDKLAELGNRPIEGTFDVVIDFPADFDVPVAYKNNAVDMYGFNAEAKNAFEEYQDRDVSDSNLTLHIKTKDTLTVDQLYTGEAYKTEYLSALNFTVAGVSLKDSATVRTDPYDVYGKMTGKTLLEYNSYSVDVAYDTVRAKVRITPLKSAELNIPDTQWNWQIIHDSTVVQKNDEERGDRLPPFMDADGGEALAVAKEAQLKEQITNDYNKEELVKILYTMELRAKEDLREADISGFALKEQPKVAQVEIGKKIDQAFTGDPVARFYAADLFRTVTATFQAAHDDPTYTEENTAVKDVDDAQTIKVDYKADFEDVDLTQYSFRVFWAHYPEGSDEFSSDSYTVDTFKQAKNSTAKKDKTFYVDEEAGLIEIYTKHFSDFAIVYVDAAPNYESSGSSGGGTVARTVTLNIDGTRTTVPVGANGVRVGDLIPSREGYTFDGFYSDSARTIKIDNDTFVQAGATIYGHFMLNTLETEDHFAYVIGYPDGTVRPLNNITREEVAMIFYRLLRDEKRAELETLENPFPDCDKESWSNIAIATMANGGYITGDTEGNFRPRDPITRAEFATMATRFAVLTDKGDASFTDIAGHWSEDYILRAAAAGWITGYEDGSFKPDQYITRAEAMTLINRVLNRLVNAEGLHKDATLWKDMNGTEWYYFAVEEATNSHTHIRQEDGKTETWIAMSENKWVKTGVYDD